MTKKDMSDLGGCPILENGDIDIANDASPTRNNKSKIGHKISKSAGNVRS
jgi:hypothetical protein